MKSEWTTLKNDLFVDPRKLFLVQFMITLTVMATGVMDYHYTVWHYIVLASMTATQLPLIMLGQIKIRLKIEMPDIVGLALVIMSMALIVYNIYINGLPYLMIKILSSLPLNEAFGDYYHQKCKLTFVLWPILTLLIPMSIFVKRRILKIIMLFWPIVASLLIQIKAIFIFGFILYLIMYQLTGRKIRFILIFSLLILSLFLFYAINTTRDSSELATVASRMGLSESWQKVSPLIWFPASYVGGPVVNGFITMSDSIAGCSLGPFVHILPYRFLVTFGYQNYAINLTDDVKTIKWLEANNAFSAISSFSQMFGLVGMLLVIFALTTGLILLIQHKFYKSMMLVAIGIVTLKNIFLFTVGNYFTDPSFAGEILILYVCLKFSKVNYARA